MGGTAPQGRGRRIDACNIDEDEGVAEHETSVLHRAVPPRFRRMSPPVWWEAGRDIRAPVRVSYLVKGRRHPVGARDRTGLPGQQRSTRVTVLHRRCVSAGS